MRVMFGDAFKMSVDEQVSLFEKSFVKTIKNLRWTKVLIANHLQKKKKKTQKKDAKKNHINEKILRRLLSNHYIST